MDKKRLNRVFLILLGYLTVESDKKENDQGEKERV